MRRRVDAQRLTDSIATVVRRRLGDLVALVRGEVAEVYLPLVRAVPFAYLKGNTLPGLAHDAGVVGRIAHVPRNTLLRGEDPVTGKRLTAILAETSALLTGDVAWVNNVLRAPTAKVVRHAILAGWVLRARVRLCNAYRAEQCKDAQQTRSKRHRWLDFVTKTTEEYRMNILC